MHLILSSMRSSLILIILFLPFLSFASDSRFWDYSAGFGARSLPFGAAARADAGYNALFWGDPAPGEFRYGFFRPRVMIQSSGLVSRAEAALAVHPISFVSLQAGAWHSQRFTTFDTIDCTSVDCKGSLSAGFLSASAAVAYGSLFASGSFRWNAISHSSSTGTDAPFAEEGSALVGTPGSDHLSSAQLIVGGGSEQWKGGILFSREKMTAAGNFNRTQALFVQRKQKAWTYSAGVGAYESSTAPRGLTVFGAIHWTGFASLDPAGS